MTQIITTSALTEDSGIQLEEGKLKLNLNSDQFKLVNGQVIYVPYNHPQTELQPEFTTSSIVFNNRFISRVFTNGNRFIRADLTFRAGDSELKASVILSLYPNRTIHGTTLYEVTGSGVREHTVVLEKPSKATTYWIVFPNTTALPLINVTCYYH